MRFDSRFSILPLCLAAALAACAADSPTLLEPSGQRPAFSSAIGVPGGCLAKTTGILPPINADGSSSFQLGRTIPVKIRFTDCETGEAVNTLTPEIALLRLPEVEDTGDVIEIVSSSAADVGTTMRSAGDGQYIFNLSTKRSQFNGSNDLPAGRYQLTISGLGLTADSVEFKIRQ